MFFVTTYQVQESNSGSLLILKERFLIKPPAGLSVQEQSRVCGQCGDTSTISVGNMSTAGAEEEEADTIVGDG